MNELKLLGYKVRDAVTGFSGVVTSISFDLYGCIQAVVTPEYDKKTGKQGDGFWFDTKRLEQLGKNPVMAVPTFVVIPGGQKLPSFPSNPK